jgi:hypothetical protein
MPDIWLFDTASNNALFCSKQSERVCRSMRDISLAVDRRYVQQYAVVVRVSYTTPSVPDND